MGLIYIVIIITFPSKLYKLDNLINKFNNELLYENNNFTIKLKI